MMTFLAVLAGAAAVGGVLLLIVAHPADTTAKV